MKGRSEDQDINHEDITIQTIGNGTLIVAMASSPNSKAIPRAKAKQKLQLPSFQSLGIAVPYPTSILTPPDEPSSMEWQSHDTKDSGATPKASESLPSNVQQSSTPQSPFLSNAILGASNDTPTQGPVGALISPSVPLANDPASGSSNSSTATEVPPNSPWLEGAISVILSHISDDSSATGVINVLYHLQPCPFSRAELGAPSALRSIINALQTRFEQVSADRFIEVTHVVPFKSSFSQLPNSPVTTPNRPAVEANMGDYFSMHKTIVFAKGTTVASHAESRKTLTENPMNKGIPQTVVVPSSITISVLERFIPPATKEEYLDLFKWNQPSALVDRMAELKPDNGNLVLIYPTKEGAMTFKNKYLGPVLDPVLRTIMGVHNVSPWLVSDIANLEAIDSMRDYEHLKVKIAQLISNMNSKAGGKLHRFKITEASKQSVHIGRDAWAEWLTEQELPRLRQIMNEYYGRGINLPQVTAAGLVREVVDGIKIRPYEVGQAPHEGIEVGVFVIQRLQ